MDDKHQSQSKFLSLVLRHAPETIDLVLDAQGWAETDELIAKAAAHGKRYTRESIARIVAESDKQRFRLSDDGQRIRANQGHSVEIDLALPSVIPPEVLYHGTATRFLEAIMREGLLKQKRQHVHLSVSLETAIKVGSRHGRPVVLVVNALAMHAAGYVFYLADNGVWLTDHVPKEFLTRQEG